MFKNILYFFFNSLFIFLNKFKYTFYLIAKSVHIKGRWDYIIIDYITKDWKNVFSDFREKFTSFSLSILEFKSVGIFAISLLLTKILLFLNFQVFFYNVHLFDDKCLSVFYRRHTACQQSLFYIIQTKNNSALELQSWTTILRM